MCGYGGVCGFLFCECLLIEFVVWIDVVGVLYEGVGFGVFCVFEEVGEEEVGDFLW